MLYDKLVLRMPKRLNIVLEVFTLMLTRVILSILVKSALEDLRLRLL